MSTARSQKFLIMSDCKKNNYEWLDDICKSRCERYEEDDEKEKKVNIEFLNSLADKKYSDIKDLYTDLSKDIINSLSYLHQLNYSIDPLTGKLVSFILIRFSKIKDIQEILPFIIAEAEREERFSLGISVSHSRFPAAYRRYTESSISSILRRDNNNPSKIFENSDIREYITKHGDKNNNIIFLCVASPVCEVGEDVDWDAMIIEPSSPRNTSQLLARLRRHRPGTYEGVNALIFARNISDIMERANPYSMPGPECEKKGRSLNGKSYADSINDKLTHTSIDTLRPPSQDIGLLNELERCVTNSACDFGLKRCKTPFHHIIDSYQKEYPFRGKEPKKDYQFYSENGKQILKEKKGSDFIRVNNFKYFEDAYTCLDNCKNVFSWLPYPGENITGNDGLVSLYCNEDIEWAFDPFLGFIESSKYSEIQKSLAEVRKKYYKIKRERNYVK